MSAATQEPATRRRRVRRDGNSYATSPMPRERADSFARCLEANRQYTGVRVEQAANGSPLFVVVYQPVDPERHARILTDQQRARQLRAEREWEQYQYWDDPDGAFTWLMSTSGEVYEVTSGSCTCPDFAYRGPLVGACKHIRGLRMRNGRRVA